MPLTPTPMPTPTLLLSLPVVATTAAGVKCHIHIATASPLSPMPLNAAATDATGAIEPRLHLPPPPPRTAWHYSLPCWQSILPEVATDLNTKER
jgi:hypothetical protein